MANTKSELAGLNSEDDLMEIVHIVTCRGKFERPFRSIQSIFKHYLALFKYPITLFMVELCEYTGNGNTGIVLSTSRFFSDLDRCFEKGFFGTRSAKFLQVTAVHTQDDENI